MPSSLEFGSLLIYSPRGTGETSVRSREIVGRIKNDGPGPFPPERMIDFAVRRLLEELPGSPLASFFPAGATIVPVPRSAPIKDAHALWIPRRIADGLVSCDIGAAVEPLLIRTSAVRKSAWSTPGNRPSLEDHVASLDVAPTPPLGSPDDIVLVDDVVTKGATLLASASVLSKAFPSARIRAFALIRTMGLVPDVDRILSPCTGAISRLRDGTVDRRP
ncbi:MAG: hypothetical protein ACYC4P_16055 [Thermoanaerobaculia bacterium]